jgi:hypothetical protein
MEFSLNRGPSNIRLFTDKYHLKRMQASHNLNAIRKFIIAFRALTMSPKGNNTRF